MESRHYEFHVTVDPETNPMEFREACDILGVESHIIYNEMPGGEAQVDLLTGSKMAGNDQEAFIELGRIAGGLEVLGLSVVRKKIETPPDHPLAPKLNIHDLPEGAYFETHFVIPNDLSPFVGGYCLSWKGVPFMTSTTDRKRADGLLFATARDYRVTAGEFERRVEDIRHALSQQLDEIEAPTVEFALYDSHPDHDKEWVEAYRNL